LVEKKRKSGTNMTVHYKTQMGTTCTSGKNSLVHWKTWEDRHRYFIVVAGGKQTPGPIDEKWYGGLKTFKITGSARDRRDSHGGQKKKWLRFEYRGPTREGGVLTPNIDRVTGDKEIVSKSTDTGQVVVKIDGKTEHDGKKKSAGKK